MRYNEKSLATRAYLMAKSSFVSLVPFISSRIQTGSMPRPDHFSRLCFLLRYFGFALARLRVFGTRMTARTAAPALLDQANEMVARNPNAVAMSYLAVTKEKIAADELAALITMPGAIFSATPKSTMKYADYMHRIGLIKTRPISWKDYFLVVVHDRFGS